jgi:hypothetical protein
VERFPDLPVEEEGRLSDPRLRENFVERVFAYWRCVTLLSGRWSVGDLVRFHTAHKLILMAHSPERISNSGVSWHELGHCRTMSSNVATPGHSWPR